LPLDRARHRLNRSEERFRDTEAFHRVFVPERCPLGEIDRVKLTLCPERVDEAVLDDRHGARALVEPEVVSVGGGIRVSPDRGPCHRVERFDYLFVANSVKEDDAIASHRRPRKSLADLSAPDDLRARRRPHFGECRSGIDAIPRRTEKLRPVGRSRQTADAGDSNRRDRDGRHDESPDKERHVLRTDDKPPLPVSTNTSAIVRYNLQARVAGSMHRLSFVLFIVLLAIAPGKAADNLVLDVFRDYLDALRVQAGIPGMAGALVGQDDLVWEYGFGRQDLARGVAARPDTPFHLDGLTQTVTATVILRCVEEGRLSLNDRLGRFRPANPDANATIEQMLAHLSGPVNNPTFSYQPERLEPLTSAIRACTDDSFRETIANILDRNAMLDSVPGPDAASLTPPAEGIPEPAVAERYARVLDRLAAPYAVRQQRPSPSRHPATTLLPASGLISTARDLAKFDLALKRGVILRSGTLERAWQPPQASDGRRLPHGLGWFVQVYGGELIVWQFGVSENAGSSLVVTAPRRGLTLILLANSDGLARGFSLEAGDLTSSPFGRLFLSLFVR
jgi:CubicO group peptidase (beta-lactamase class C family)